MSQRSVQSNGRSNYGGSRRRTGVLRGPAPALLRAFGIDTNSNSNNNKRPVCNNNIVNRELNSSARSNSNNDSNTNSSNNHNDGVQGNNGIVNWIQTKSRRPQHPPPNTPVVVGTEANAIQQMKHNAKYFKYPPEGFITPIEHSLLYAMIQYPDRYPDSVVKGEVDEEEFEQYLYVKDDDKITASRNRRMEECDRNQRNEEVEESDNPSSNNFDHHENLDERRVSYAQLSALLALSAEKNSSTASPPEPDSQSQHPPSITTTDAFNSRTSSVSYTNNKRMDGVPLSIGQALCRKLLRTITKYSDKHNLDRQTEIREFLSPVEKRCQVRNEKAALRTLLPAYAGYTLSILTGNPIPLLIGVAALTVEDDMADEMTNVNEFKQTGGRQATLETAGLLDECDSD